MAQTGYYQNFVEQSAHRDLPGNILIAGSCLRFGLMSVCFLYLKFLFIWRFFRTWALADGIVPPENMPKCIIATTSITGFWRGWHTSFYKWLLRYIYLPLGGNMSAEGTDGFRGHLSFLSQPWAKFARHIANVALVFTFVAVWHEPTNTTPLLAWGGLIVACLVPELVADAVMRREGMAS